MALSFLIISLVSAWLTYNVYRPLSSGPRVAFLSFLMGWTWGELALHVVVAEVVLVALFAGAGVLGSSLGQLALFITALSCGALAYQYLEFGSAAAAAVDDALEKGLGRDYRGDLAAERSRSLEEDIDWSSLIRPFHALLPEVERVRDIPFDRQRGINLKLDIYRPRSMPVGCPVLLQIHGGGWMIGDKREQGLPLMNRLAANGWVCVNANYRLSPHATFPEHVIDCKSALAWIRRHVAKYGGDPDFVVVTGGSAGGHLAAMIALTANDPEYQPGFEEVDTTVAAAVPMYGVYDWTDRFGFWPNRGLTDVLERHIIKGSIDEAGEDYHKGSPMDRIHAGRPPFMVVHGDHDSLVPVAEARRFAEMLRECGDAEVVYAEIPGAQHAFDLFKSLRERHVSAAVERYLEYVYSRYLADKEQLEKPANGDPSGASEVVMDQAEREDRSMIADGAASGDAA